jgi:putative ABC transport system substrate-binding protein
MAVKRGLLVAAQPSWSMHRRAFLFLAAGIAAIPTKGRAQQANLPVIGFLSSRSSDESAYVVEAFREGLRDAGFVDGKNVTIAFRWADGDYSRLPSLAADLVSQRVTLLFTAGGPPSALAAKTATTSIPIVFSAANDPVRQGLVTSLARPGGNITGMSTLTTGLVLKRLELIKGILPKAAMVVLLVNQASPAVYQIADETQAAAKQLRINVPVLSASSEQELDQVFEGLPKLHADALVVYGDPYFDSRRDKIVTLCMQQRLPACYPWREYVLAGGLMSYGTSLTGAYRQAAIYVGRILKGEKPGDLPVQEPTRFELVISLKTAGALGIHLPPALLAQADEVLE